MAPQLSISLETALELPIGDPAVVLELFPFRGVHVMIDNVITKGGAQHLRSLHQIGRLAQGLRDLAERLTLVGIADISAFKLQLLLDAGKPCGEQRGKREIRIEVCAAHAALDANAVAVGAAQPEAGGAVVERPDRLGRGEGASLEAL